MKLESIVAKKEGPGIVQHIHCLLQTLPASFCLINLSSTDTYIHLDSNRLIARLLICLYFEDRQTYQHITGHSTSHNVFSHICIKTLCISFSRYIHTPTAQACPFKTTNLIVPGVLVPLLHPLILLQLELGYLSDVAEIQDIAEALSYLALFFSNFSISPKLSPSSKTTALSAVWSPSLLPVLSFTPSSILYLPPKNCLSLWLDFWFFFLKRSVASSRSFSKTFSADLIRSRICRLATLIEHASSMLAAAISIPAHNSKESHAIFMQYWWGTVTPSQLIHSHPEL